MIHYRRRKPNFRKFSSFVDILLFILLAALIIFVLAVILGNYLNSLVEKTDEELEEIPVTDEVIINAEDEEEEYDFSGLYAECVGFDFSSCTTYEEIYSAVAAYSDCDTISLEIKGSDGKLIYYSQALASLAKLPATEETQESVYDEETDTTTYLPAPTQRIEYIIKTAHSLGLRVSAVIEAYYSNGVYETAEGYGTASDCALVKELSEFGFDEVVITGLFDGVEFETDSNNICEYLTSVVTSEVNSKTGIVIPASCFVNTANARYIRSIGSKADFMCVEFDNDTDEEIDEMYSKIKGSFKAYNLRVFEDGNNTGRISELIDLIQSNSITNYQFTENVKISDYTASEAGAEQPDESAADEVTSNPYATTTVTDEPDYSESTSDDSVNDDSTSEETQENDNTYRSDGQTSWY